IFGRILTLEQVPETLGNLITNLSDNPWVFLIVLNLLLLVVGTFMETIAAVTILTPILLPIAILMCVDPIHFGVIMIVNLSLGFITPPLGINLFVAASISNLRVEQIVIKIIPGFIALVVVLLLVTYIPGISTILLD